MIVICPYCKNIAALVTGKELYRHRTDLMHQKFWLCKDCYAYVGCHKGTDKPLGRLADKELRYWKKKAHAVFDPFWKTGRIKRREAYKRLAKKLDIPFKKCHIGKFDIEMCKKVVDLCKGYY
ncbi:MAG: zinc-finger-containing protein [Candidatus Thorarchaeota archaeon]